MWFIARAGAGRRLLTGLLLAALVGLAGGVVLTAWAGARRTESAYERLVAASHHPDLVVTAEGDDTGAFDPSVAVDAPGVQQAGVVIGLAAVELRSDGTPALERVRPVLAPVDDVAFRALDRPLLVEGRAPDPSEPDEIVVPEALRDAGYPIGSVHPTCLADFDKAFAFGRGVLDGTATVSDQLAFVDAVCMVRPLRVVGVSRPGPDEVVLREDSEAEVFTIGTPALADLGPGRNFSFVLVELQPGADLDRFTDFVLDEAAPGGGASVQSAALRTTVVQRTVEPYVQALALFALVAAVAAAGVLGPAIVRWAGTPERDRAPLLAVGLRPHQLRLASALRGLVLGLVAAVVATAIAVVGSRRFPIGIAARIEPDPGIRLDGFVLAVGLVGVVVTAAVLGAVASPRAHTAVRRPSRVAEGLQAMGVGPAPVAGVRGALTGSSLVRTAGGVATALIAIVTALTYQAGLGRLLDTPARFGWTWDYVLQSGDEDLTDAIARPLREDPDVEGFSIGRRASIVRGGAAVQLFSFEPVEGHAYPVLVEGRAPQGASEIALGAQTLDRLDARIGDQLGFRGPDGSHLDLAVVGEVLLPLASLGQDLSVAEGGLIDVPLMEQLRPTSDEDPDPAELVLLDLADGATPDDLTAALTASALAPADLQPISGPIFPADLRGYDAVRGTPLLLAGVLGLLGLGVLAHTITTTEQRRRRELAVLRCLGFVRRDLRRTVRWNALALAGLCLVIAVPLGIGLGRTLWSSFAESVGLIDDPVTPVVAVSVVVAATLLGAVALAIVPGRRAGRVRAAAVLRSE